MDVRFFSILTHSGLTDIYLQNNEIDGFQEKIIENTKVQTLNMANNLCASESIYDTSTARDVMRTVLKTCFDNYDMTVIGKNYLTNKNLLE